MKSSIIKEIHENGHFHYHKMKELIEREYYIDNLHNRISRHITNCVRCILAERKRGKGEGLLNPIPKGERPLQQLHIDHLGPMQATRKQYRYIFAIIDGFTKFCWLFPTKTLGTEEAINKLELMAETFGYPERMTADRGGAFTANAFRNYCSERDIKLSHITVGVPRANGQVERLHSTVISVLTKLSIEEPEKWHSHVKPLQQILNSTYQRAIKMSPFKLLTGIEMRTKADVKILEIVGEENINQFEDGRQQLREQAKVEIAKMQMENKK